MKFCVPHWNALRDEIENKRGLQQFVSRGGKELLHRAIEPGSHNPLGVTGDPLMHAHNLILAKSMELLSDNGINPMFLFAATDVGYAGFHDGDYCPLCVVSSCNDPKCPNDCRNRDKLFIGKAGDAVAREWADRLKAGTQ